ncbi:xylulokinase [Pelomonas aquatica]|jgi:xylulokinase|uniref:Xylulose kinase n=1 Tax=Pelomonas aquatica TaxID=431058 RepID=A0A9X4LL70_9BURK|nr:xylulokinase [Pelomonas aquatica]MCY4756269.1 xylulokinase [Pelomonas aquatica]MDG0864981.1 xylulokinase [Pelomonas aquatica]
MFLGIDLGTSELKLLLLDEQHRIAATTGVALTVQRPQPLCSEQDPAAWWAALDEGMARLRQDHGADLAAVRGIGLSGQMHGAVTLDAAGQVLRPAILWNDGRAGAQCAGMMAACPELPAITGNLTMPGFTAPKLAWMRQHEPELFARVARVLLPKDWLRLQLSGEYVSEMSDAAGTLWLDVAQRRWSPEALALTGLDEGRMPRLVEGSEASAMLKPALAARWGLGAGIPIAGGGGDNAASAVGMGVVKPGQGFLSLGTSGVIFLCNESFSPNPARAVHAFCHALPGTWHQMSVMLSAASALRWVTQTLGQPGEAVLIDQVARLTPAQRERAPLFLPYLSGERTPHNDANAQGVFFGLTHEHDAAALGYAVLEGVGFGLLDGWQALQAGGGAAESLWLVGGGARSAWWARLLASLLGTRLVNGVGAEAGGALGAARLAWLACGGTPGEVCRTPDIARVAEPDAALAAALRPRHQRFQRLYGALRAEFG